jgi:2-dehydro-3-deoxygluconokinase
MLRLASADGVRLAASRTLDATFGGGEANVAISLARMGVDAAFVTALPDNDLGKPPVIPGRPWRRCRRHHDSTWAAGITSSNRGRHNVRVACSTARSPRSCNPAEDFAWESLLAGAAWFRTTGITPALSASAAEAAVAGGGESCWRDRLGRP